MSTVSESNRRYRGHNPATFPIWCNGGVGVVGFEPTQAKPPDLQSGAPLQLRRTPIYLPGIVSPFGCRRRFDASLFSISTYTIPIPASSLLDDHLPKQVSRPRTYISGSWSYWDSNPEPSPCKGDALPVRAIAPESSVY